MQPLEQSVSAPAAGAGHAWHRRLKRRAYEVVELSPPGDPLSNAFDLFILALILGNVLAMVLGTVPSLQARHAGLFAAFEGASVLVFSVEYLLRLWCSNLSPRYPGTVRGRLRYAVSPLALLDLAAVLPFWLSVSGLDLRVLRAIRLLRVFQLAKLVRYSAALQTFLRILRAKQEELLVTLALIAVLLFWASTLIYYAERGAQPEVFSSIPAAMWWAVCTLTTVGYGDIYPVTVLGKVLASVISILGIGIFALPTGILGAEFVSEIQHKRTAVCPHCGKEIDHAVGAGRPAGGSLRIPPS